MWLLSCYLPLKKYVALHLYKFEYALPKNILCHVWLVLMKEIFKSYQYIFTLLLFSPHLHLKETESPLPKDVLCKVWLNLTRWFWRRCCQCIFFMQQLYLYLPLTKGMTLHLNKLESSSTRNALCQVWWNLT